jgi:hypothetical protein
VRLVDGINGHSRPSCGFPAPEGDASDCRASRDNNQIEKAGHSVLFKQVQYFE